MRSTSSCARRSTSSKVLYSLLTMLVKLNSDASLMVSNLSVSIGMSIISAALACGIVGERLVKLSSSSIRLSICLTYSRTFSTTLLVDGIGILRSSIICSKLTASFILSLLSALHTESVAVSVVCVPTSVTSGVGRLNSFMLETICILSSSSVSVSSRFSASLMFATAVFFVCFLSCS
ncbi:unnamed protein product, partial [Ceratitis capitata]